MKKMFLKSAWSILATWALLLPAHAANLLANPGFVPATGQTFAESAIVAPPQWSNVSQGIVIPNGPMPNNYFTTVDPNQPNDFPLPSYNGSVYFYDLGGYGNPSPKVGDGIAQTFATQPGHKYRVTFGLNSEANGLVPSSDNSKPYETGSDVLRVQAGDQDVAFASPYQSGSPGYGVAKPGIAGVGAWQMPWVERSFVFTAGSGTTTTIRFTVKEKSINHYPDPEDPTNTNLEETSPNGSNDLIIGMPLVEELAPVLTVVKALGGTGRLNNNDQFVVSIQKNGVVQNSTANSTTKGSGSTVDAGSGTTGPFVAEAGQEYTLHEAMADGSVSSLSSYASSVRCVNAFAQGTQFPTDLALNQAITLAGSDVVTCTITNAPGLARLTINKISTGATGSFSFKGTAANANGFSTDNSYAVSTTEPGKEAKGSGVNLAAINTLTEIQETIPAGWNLTAASCVDANAAASGNPTSTFGVIVGNTLQIPAGNVRAGADLQCTFSNAFTGLALSGKVILDTGVGSGTPHDAIQNGSETGHGGVALSLTNCSGTVYSSSTSAGDGSFSLSLAGAAPGPVCLVESLPLGYRAVSVNTGTTSGSYNAGTTTLQFTMAANTSYSGIVLGQAPQSTLTSDGAQQTTAGQIVSYAHVYTAGSGGSVVFATTDNPSPAGLIWTSVLYQDNDCDGSLNSGDTLLTSSVNVTAGKQICLLVTVNTPAGAASGVQDTTTLSATETWSLPTLSPSNATFVLSNTDLTTVSSAGLSLRKDVRVLSACPADPAASLANTTPYADRSNARPGAFLEYRVSYKNNTAAPLSVIRINDTVLAYTQYVRAFCLATPTNGIASCAVTQQPASGAGSGAIAWSLSDASSGPVIGLQPQASGAVSFCLQVQQ